MRYEVKAVLTQSKITSATFRVDAKSYNDAKVKGMHYMATFGYTGTITDIRRA